jgi:hypothetical protein
VPQAAYIPNSNGKASCVEEFEERNGVFAGGLGKFFELRCGYLLLSSEEIDQLAFEIFQACVVKVHVLFNLYQQTLLEHPDKNLSGFSI